MPVRSAKAASGGVQGAEMLVSEEVLPTSLGTPERDKVICG